MAYVASNQPDYTWDDTTNLDAIVAGTIEAVLSQPAPEPGPDLDRLAALAYQGGRYDLAEKLSQTTNVRWACGCAPSLRCAAAIVPPP